MKRSNIYMKNYDLSEIKTLVDQVKNDKTRLMVTNTLSEEVVSSIIDEVVESLKLTSKTTAWVLITGVLQKGGSNLKVGNAISFRVGEHTLSSHDLQKIIKKHSKNATARQFARTIADDIAAIALELNIPGDLHAQMRYKYPDITDTDAVWCSNFQTTNPRCPENVRNWLVENYKARFNR